MPNKKPPIKNKILEDYLISGSHGLKSFGGLVASGIISTFGVYSLVIPFFTDTEGNVSNSLNVALFSFVIILIMFDTIKRGSLTKFFNSSLKAKIIGSKTKKGYLFIAVFATVFMILLDSLGVWSTAEKGANLYSQFKTNSSTEFQILQQNAKSGATTASNYTLELQAWKDNKSDAKTNCNDKFKGWKAKYKAKCKEDWNTANPMPVQTANGQIKIADYQAIKNDNLGFLDKYLFNILFVLLLLMTLLMQYLTIAKIYDDYNDIEESLTFERVEFINDTIQEHETILAEHEQQTAEMMANSKREKNVQDRKFRKVGEAIAIEHKKKNVETRGKTVQRIANNVYVPKEEAKAGHVVNPFSYEEQFREKNQHEKNLDDEHTQNKDFLKGLDSLIEKEEKYQSNPLNEDRYNEEAQNKPQTKQPLNESVITDAKETEPLNGVVKRMDLKNYSHDDLELIDLLWKQSTVKRNDQLETRDNVLKVIGDNKNNTLRLRNLYKKLLADKYVYKRVGYFSNVDL